MEELPAGDVELGQPIGSGGFGLVYRGRSKKLGMEVAVKILNRKNCKEFSMLMKETDMMSKANSTYVLRVLALYKENKGHIEYGLVMEYMPHGSLYSLFNTFKANGVVIPRALTFQILHQVAIAMNFLHGLDPAIIHRDLKPQNVLLRKDLDVQLTDFGLARNETSISTGLVGTLSYMPPECDNQKPTKKFDVYSFAILIWWILSDEDFHYPPALNTDLIMNCKKRGIRPDIKHLDYCMTEKMVPEVIELMKQCWDGDPDSRPCFTECMERLEKMKKAYDGEIEDAVLEVLKELRKASSPSLEDNKTAATENAKALEHGGKFPESQQLDLKAAGEDTKPPMALQTVGDSNNKQGEFWYKTVEVIRNSGGYTKITGQLSNEGVLSEEDQQKLNSSQNAKDFGIAVKEFGEKLVQKPEHVLPVLKSFFKF